jgi:hypothetical protein
MTCWPRGSARRAAGVAGPSGSDGARPVEPAGAEELLVVGRAGGRGPPLGHAASAGPRGLDTDAVAGELRGFVVEHLGADAVLMLVATGDLKGRHTVGVQRPDTAPGEHAAGPAPHGLIPMTCSELQRLLTRLVLEPGRRPADPHASSLWRRRHQYRARASHYRRQAAPVHDQEIYGSSV